MSKTQKSQSFMLVAFSIFNLIWASTSNSIGQSGPAEKGVGPVTELKLGPLDENLAKKGKELFSAKCGACHKMEERFVGPALKDVTKRRQPEWILNMILNPVEMTQKDPEAMKLLEEFLTQMTFQNVTEEEAKNILEYFRRYAEKGDFEVAKKDSSKDSNSKNEKLNDSKKDPKKSNKKNKKTT